MKFKGWNTYKTHPKLKRTLENGFENSCFHAETKALYKVPKKYRNKIKLFVTRVNNQGKLIMSKPCEHCQLILKKEGVKFKNVWYTNQEGDWVNLQKGTKNEYFTTKRYPYDNC